MQCEPFSRRMSFQVKKISVALTALEELLRIHFKYAAKPKLWKLIYHILNIKRPCLFFMKGKLSRHIWRNPYDLVTKFGWCILNEINHSRSRQHIKLIMNTVCRCSGCKEYCLASPTHETQDTREKIKQVRGPRLTMWAMPNKMWTGRVVFSGGKVGSRYCVCPPSSCFSALSSETGSAAGNKSFLNASVEQGEAVGYQERGFLNEGVA